LCPAGLNISAACLLGQVGADDAIEHGVDVEVGSQLSGRCGVLDDGGRAERVQLLALRVQRNNRDRGLITPGGAAEFGWTGYTPLSDGLGHHPGWRKDVS